MNLPDLLKRIDAGEDLGASDAHALFDAIMDNRVAPDVLAACLRGLAAKGETVAEIVGAARAMRARVTPVRVPAGVSAIDTCGTGGDGRPVLNVSSCVAMVAAAAGATVAKHGNRSNTRPSGSAEVLAALGVNVEAEVPILERCLERCRVAFLYAARLHPAMKHAAPVRRELGIRTIFNLVGPLTNPAGVRRQLLGVNRPALVATMAEALRELGAERALIVHGREGLCDLSIAGPSLIADWDGQQLRLDEVDPRVARCEPAALATLHVTGPEHSAAVIRSVLAGERGPAREIVVFNTAAALRVAGLAADWLEGGERARDALDSGAAAATLKSWVEQSRGD